MYKGKFLHCIDTSASAVNLARQPKIGYSLTLNTFLYEKDQDRGHRARLIPLLHPAGQEGPCSRRTLVRPVFQLYPLALYQRRQQLLSRLRLLTVISLVKVGREADLYPPANTPNHLSS